MRPVKHESELTEEVLEEMLRMLAWIVETYGDQYIPLYENVERRLAQVRARGDTRERIRKLLGPTGSSART